MKSWIATLFGVALVAGLWASHHTVTNTPPELQSSSAVAPVPVAAPPEVPDVPPEFELPDIGAPPARTGPPTRTYDEMLEAAGFRLNSELHNSPSGTLRAYVTQHLEGNLQDEEFIGAVAWHLAIRNGANLGHGNTDHQSRQFKRVAFFAALSATALQDSAPIRHVAQNYLGNQGREEMGIALATWATATFDDDSTTELELFIRTMNNSANQRGYPLDEDKITEVLSWLYYYETLLPRTPSGSLAAPGVPHA